MNGSSVFTDGRSCLFIKMNGSSVFTDGRSCHRLIALNIACFISNHSLSCQSLPHTLGILCNIDWPVEVSSYHLLSNSQLVAVRVVPWAKANLNYTAQALIISAASIAAYFITADKYILECARRNAQLEDSLRHQK